MLVSFQRAHNVVAVETQFGSEIGKILDAADVATLLEVRREQRLLHLELAAAQFRVVQQLVRLDRVGVLQRVVVVVEADRAGDARDPLDHLLRGVDGDPLVLGEELELAALEVDGRVGGELEGVVLDLDRHPRLGGARLEAALADEAPRAGDVGPDVDLDGFGHIRGQRRGRRVHSPAAAAAGAGCSERVRAMPCRRAPNSIHTTKPSVKAACTSGAVQFEPSEPIVVVPSTPLAMSSTAITLLTTWKAMPASSPPVRHTTSA